MTDNDVKISEGVLERAINALGEQFSTVQVIATYETDGDTTMFHHGTGNYYARYGSVKEWVAMQEERFKEDEDEED